MPQTFGDLLVLYLDDCRSPSRATPLKPSTLQTYTAAAKTAGDLAAVPVEKISRPLLARWHRALSGAANPRTGKPMRRRANAALQLVSRCLSWGADFGYSPAVNAATGIRRNEERPRERWLDQDECAAFLRALPLAEAELLSRKGCGPGRARCTRAALAAIKILYLTGCRRREITGLLVAEVDAPALLLRLKDSKSGARPVPVSRGAMAMLTAKIREHGAASPWVFPSTSLDRPVDFLDTAWALVKEIAGFGDDVCLHTLRHTWACQAILAGVPLEVIARVLGHSSARVTEAHYAHVLVTTAACAAANTVGDLLAAFGEAA